MHVICSEVRFVEFSSPNECDKILKIPNEQAEPTDYMANCSTDVLDLDRYVLVLDCYVLDLDRYVLDLDRYVLVLDRYVLVLDRYVLVLERFDC